LGEQEKKSSQALAKTLNFQPMDPTSTANRTHGVAAALLGLCLPGSSFPREGFQRFVDDPEGSKIADNDSRT
jgi:hypothetical protein